MLEAHSDGSSTTKFDCPLDCGGLPPLSVAATSRGDSQTADKSAVEKAGASPRTPNSDIKKGFVYKRVPSSVTLSGAKGLGSKRRDSSASPRNDREEQLVVTIKGLDIYDPTTGQIRSHSTDDIACWFIDTNYNGESFFVRHAYFTGAEEPYDKLKRALRAEIDEAAWSALYSTTSRPFDPPKTGKIAIKVINHYGDEVLRVYETKKETSSCSTNSST